MTASPSAPEKAGMPTEEEVARVIVKHCEGRLGWTSIDDSARAVLALFAEVMAEKDSKHSRSVCDSAQVDDLAADSIASPFNACCYREQCKALEARALAAEEALAPFDDALGEDDDGYPDDTKLTLTWRAHTDYTLTLGDLRKARAAIRQGD